MLTPICFAVLRLITSSNFVGCSTGQVGGLGSLQDSVNEYGDAPMAVRSVRRHTTLAHRPLRPIVC